MTVTFDPVRFKETTRQQWQDAAAAWQGWAPTIEAWLGRATTRMMDAITVLVAELREAEPPAERYDPRLASKSGPAAPDGPTAPDDQR